MGLKRIEVESAVAAAIGELRNAILTGDMQPGEVIQIRQLAGQLGLSHIPIREALRQLEAEGLVISTPRRAPIVAGVTVEDLSAIYELRRLVEIPTARLAMHRSTPADLAAVRSSFERMQAATRAPDAPHFWDVHQELHWAFIAAGTNEWTQRTLEPLWHASERYVRLFVVRFGSQADALRMHKSLVTAYESSDPDLFADALSEHFAETEEVVREGFRAASADVAVRPPHGVVQGPIAATRAARSL